MTTPRCDACRFWDHAPERIQEGFGNCRRNAPVPVRYEPGQRYQPLSGGWPVTAKDSWCGEFQEKSNPEAERMARGFQAMLDEAKESKPTVLLMSPAMMKRYREAFCGPEDPK